MDGLSTVHYKAVRTEIEGRFFSQEEVNQLKEMLDLHTITDPQIRMEAAKTRGHKS